MSTVNGFQVGSEVLKYNYESLQNYNTPNFSSSSSKVYAIGDYVMYNGKLYKCTTATTGGTWNVNNWAEAILTDDVTEQKNALEDVAEDQIDIIQTIFTKGKIINSDGSISSLVTNYGVTNAIDISGYRQMSISSKMGYSYLIYAFYQADNTFISGRASPNDGYITLTDEVVAIPANAKYLIVASTSLAFLAVKGEKGWELKIQDDVDKLVEAYPATALYEAIPITPIAEKYINPSGIVSDITGSSSYVISGYVDVSDYSNVHINASNNYGNALYAFYGSDYSVVAVGTIADNVSTNTVLVDQNVVVPPDAKYICIAGRVGSSATYVLPSVSYLSKYTSGKWAGKKWVCVGDSLTEVNATATKKYYDYIRENTGISITVMGVSGTGYARTNGANTAFYQRVLNCPSDADVVTIFGSFNDLGAGLPIGDVDDSGTSTIAGCINTTIDNLQSVIPLLNLGVVAPTPWETTQPSDSGNAYNYVAMLKAICDRRSIPFLDLWHCSNLRPWDEDFREAAYSHDSGGGTHPDENGHKLIAPRFEALLDSLLLH